MKKQVIAAVCALGFTCAAGAEIVLWNNGPIVTHPGQGFGGADVSMAGLDVPIAGVNVRKINGHFRIADDFHTSGATWSVDAVTVLIYATNADPGDFPWSGIDLNLWAGAPGEGAVVASTGTFTLEFTGIYRVFAGEDNLNNPQRPVMAAKLLFANPVILSPGTTYWIDVQAQSAPGFVWAWLPLVMAPSSIDEFNPFTRPGNVRQLGIDGEWGEYAYIGPDGPVQGAEVPFLVHGMPYDSCPADLNGDGVVDVSDLLVLLGAWGACSADECDHASACNQAVPCNGGPCFCVETYAGVRLCKITVGCSGIDCPDGVCPPGYVCIVNTCCGPTTCTPVETFDCPESATEIAAMQREIGTRQAEFRLE